MKLVIVNYGMGNLKSVTSAIRYLGYNDISLSNEVSVLKSADKLILPGVGNYASAMNKINELDLKSCLRRLVLEEGKPILGICLGMQLMGHSSTESGFNSGLGLVDGIVEAFASTKLKIPHVGYNQVNPFEGSRLYSGIHPEPDYYFTHSFRMRSNADIGKTTCTYGEKFVASFEIDNIAGVQFHPELSQTNGLKLLRNYIELF
ncbi:MULTISPECIES: imidazole glycerol phosphate synthase subunit HisH [Shewanella]|uniref:imidazole glycerol phosphate synthase subunit HisH n=1 Tax=Shewanella TaxID=22 RepID=UPI00048FEAA9|nr:MULTISPECIES: imidazole glycerol phosphate synthase subunit HisH [Shewanella]MDL2195602.1 imidazole glycerol phosphate synthase subunit HisH [Shewanella algae]BCV48797.1 imidazole glycerol phosphate synthase subunit HisH [Shewanella algae]HEW9976513.1 imidazole glycerol phosphate synthase subunit HisH [Shewanella algae]